MNVAAILVLSATVGATEPVSDVLERMAEAYAGLVSLEASLTQTSSYPQLGISDPPETGRLQIEKRDGAMNVRLEIDNPERRILVVSDGGYTLYQPRIKQAIVGRADGGRSSHASFLKFLVGDVSDVEDQFRVELIEADTLVDGRAATHIQLLPRKTDDSFYKIIDLWVDDELGLPIQERLVEPNGDEVLVELDSVRVNAPSPGFVFELVLPDDVERIRN